jgi:hypothetical protein
VYCRVNPFATDPLAGVTAIDTSAGAVTVKVLLSVNAPWVAVIVEVPTATAVARPVALMVAIEGADDDHATVAVIFAVDPSVYVPVAVYCRVNPFATDPLAGVTAIDTSAGAVTVMVLVLLIAPCVAVIVDVPTATAVASPVALMAAIEGADDDHVAVAVIFAVEPSV